MNVPDVVQTLSAMIVFRAVLLVPIQLWFGPIPNASNSGSSPSAPRTSLNSPSGAKMNSQTTVMAAELTMAGK